MNTATRKIEKKKLRQIKWIRKTYPIGALIKWRCLDTIGIFSSAYKTKVGIILGYHSYDNHKEQIRIQVLSSIGTIEVNQKDIIKNIQNVYSKRKFYENF